MVNAFVTTTPVRTSAAFTTSSVKKCSTKPTITMATPEQVVEKYYPVYKRDRAPVIEINQSSVSVSMSPIQAFCTSDITAGPLLDYSDPDEFVPDIPVPPSAISWPSGDGRGDKEFKGVPSAFEQPNLKIYGPFPDYLKRSCDL